MKSLKCTNLKFLFSYSVIILIFSIASLSLKCSYLVDLDFLDEESGFKSLDYSMMEIHYKTWSEELYTSTLDIFKDGSVKAYLYSPSHVLLDSAYASLRRETRENFANMFGYFSYYDDYYEPTRHILYATYYQIVLNYKEEIPDTVTVCLPTEENIPVSLMDILISLETIRTRMIYNIF